MIEWKKNLSPTTTSKGTQNDNMYQLLGGARNNNDSEDDSALEENLLKLKDYTYFDGDKILASQAAILIWENDADRQMLSLMSEEIPFIQQLSSIIRK